MVSAESQHLQSHKLELFLVLFQDTLLQQLE